MCALSLGKWTIGKLGQMAAKDEEEKMTNKQNETSPTDSVGYKRPPQAHRFAAGQSGNPNGRPKGTRNFKTDLREELDEIVSFHEGGRELSISKQRALIKRLVASAIGGDARAIATIVSFCARAFGDDDEDRQGEAPEDHEIMLAFGKRRAKRGATNPTSHKNTATPKHSLT